MIRRSTWLLLGVFLLLLGSAVLLGRLQNQREGGISPTPTNPPLFDSGGALITGLRISAINGGLIELQLDPNGNWTLVNLPAEVVDASRIASVINTIEGINLLTKIEEPPALELIGLKPANYRITVRFDNGREESLTIGAKTPTQTGYYLMQEDGTVAIVSSFNVDSLIDLLTTPPVVKTPTPTPTVEETATQQP